MNERNSPSFGSRHADEAPLSWGQKQMYRAMRIDRDAAHFHMTDVLALQGDVDLPRLARSLADTFASHATLHLRFVPCADDDDGVAQRFDDIAPIECPVHDWSGLPPGEAAARFAALRVRFRETPFDLAAAPLFRYALVRLSSRDSCLLLTVHHLLADDWSMGLLHRELAARYAGRDPARPARDDGGARYLRFARRQHAWLRSDEGARAVAYWADRLGALPAQLALPVDRQRSVAGAPRKRTLTGVLPVTATRQLHALARATHATLFSILLAAYDVLLWRLSRCERVPVATLVANRGDGEFDDTVGLFFNTIVLVSDVRPDQPFRDFAARVAEITLEGMARQQVPFQYLVERLCPVRDPARVPFTQALFAFMNASGPRLRLGDVALAQLGGIDAGSTYDLKLTAYEKDAAVEVVFEYDASVVEPSTAQAWLDVYLRMLMDAAREPDTPLTHLGWTRRDSIASRMAGDTDVLDDWGVPVPAGFVGQLCRFDDPSAAPVRLGVPARRLADLSVRTLDTRPAHYDVDGGRIDIDAVERCARAVTGVRRALLTHDVEHGLVMHLMVDEAAFALAVLRRALFASLPMHGVPSRFRVVPWIVEQVGGAPDLDELWRVGRDADDASRKRPPRDAHEAAVLRIWADALRFPELGAEDDFFAVGGNSLSAALIVAEVNREFGCTSTLQQLFDARTVARFAVMAAQRREDAARGAWYMQPDARSDEWTRIEEDGSLSYPVSEAQARMWVLDRLPDVSDRYVMKTAYRIDGALDVSAMRASFAALVRRHEQLRAVFRAVGGEIRQCLLPTGAVRLDEARWEGETPSGDAPPAHLIQDLDAAFDLGSGPLIRARLVHTNDPKVHYLYVALHHIVADGWSMGVIVDDWLRLYSGRDALPVLPAEYRDYCCWRRSDEARQAVDADLRYWRDHLGGARGELALPARTAEPGAGPRAGHHSFRLSAVLCEGLGRIAAAHGASIHAILLAGFAIVLSRYSGQSDLCIGAPVANRDQEGTAPIVGLFVNTVVLRMRIDAGRSLADLLAATRDTVIDALAHAGAPFEEVVQALQPQRHLDASPLFEAMFAFQAFPPSVSAPDGLTLRGIAQRTQQAKFKLSGTVTLGAGIGYGEFEFREDLLDPAMIGRLAADYVSMLEQWAAHPDAGILALTPHTARVSPVAPVSADEAGLGGVRALCEIVSRQARRVPDQPALRDRATTLSYAELDAGANRVAARLRAQRVGAGSRIGLGVPRSADAIVCLLGILRAGAAYSPMDMQACASDWREHASDAGLHAIVLAGPAGAGLDGVRTIALDYLVAPMADGPAAVIASGTAQASAVVFRTSGSTGRPKCVTVPHQGVLALIAWACGAYAAREYRNSTFATALTFDVSLFEMFTPWALGGCATMLESLQVVPEADAPLTCVSGTPSHVAMLLDRGDFPAGAATLNVAGEPLPRRLVERIFAQTDVQRVVNLYGPTECSIYASVEDIRRATFDGAVGIGRPHPHAALYLVDDALSEMPAGVPGEICIGGSGLAHGYAGQPALTAEHFIPDPFAGEPGARMYRTRDLGRVDERGHVAYLGRANGVRKLRGVWVNFHDLTADVRACDGVSDAVVLPIASGDDEDDARVIAFCVPEAGAILDETTLRQAFRARVARTRPLAYGRLVNRFIALDALPLTPNGKVDVHLLAQWEWRARPEPRVPFAPSDPFGHLLRDAWRNALKRDDIAQTDDFFALGGHSLLALRMLAELERATGLALPLVHVFEFPVFAEFAAQADALARAGGASQPGRDGIRPIARGGHLPVTSAQRRMWFLDQLDPGATHYNVSVVLRVQGVTDDARFLCAIRACLQRHEVFRTSFHFVDGEVVAQLDDTHVPDLACEDWSTLTELEQRKNEAAWRAMQASHRFDLRRPGLFRLQVARLSEQTRLLALVLHHVITDADSISLLVDEIGQQYAQPARLAAPAIQYVDYAAWARARARGPAHDAHLAYWREQLRDCPEFLSLPADYPRDATMRHDGATHAFLIGRDELEQVGGLLAGLRVSRFVGLLALFKLAVHRYAGSRDICIGTPVTNRQVVSTRAMQGFFVDTLPLRTRFSPSDTLAGFIRRVHAVWVDAFRHQEPGLEAIVADRQSERVPGYHPLFQLAFAHTDEALATNDAHGLRWRVSQGGRYATPFDLTCHCNETPDGMWVTLEYKTALYAPASIAAFGAHLRRLLSCLATHLDVPLAALPGVDVGASVAAPAVRDARLTDGFARHAKANPDAIAVKTVSGEFSYATLDADSNRLARRLLADGLQPGECVALCVERDYPLIVALLAVSKAAGCFVPFDSDVPALRLRGIIAQHRITRLVSTHAIVARWSPEATQSMRDVCLYDVGTQRGPSAPGEFGAVVTARDWADARPLPVSVAHDASHAAYVIFTSGSTGAPKGVMIGHAAACATLDWINTRFQVAAGDRLMWCASPGFDLSVYDVFGVLGAGATVCVADRGMLFDPTVLAAYLTHWNVSMWDSAPAVLQFALAGCEVLGDAFRSETMRLVMLSGDRIPVTLPADGSRHFPNAHWYALGGATEAAIWSNFHDIGRAEAARAMRWQRAVPYGRAFGAAAYFVLDDDLRICPDGVEGELYIGGGCLADGYLGAPALTAERFIPDPFAASGRLYRTGDRVRRDASGTLWILGRTDTQIKLRGYRIELGEVESAIQRMPEVRAALALMDADRQEIRAYVQLTGPGALDDAQVLSYLGARLPHYMVPASVHFIDAWPTTVNGKVDRERLASDHGRAASRSPRTAFSTLAGRLATLWEEVLGTPVEDMEKSFFHYGGTSLMAVRIIGLVNERLGAALQVIDVFRYPTPTRLAMRIAAPDAQPPSRPASPADPAVVSVWKAGDGRTPMLIFIAPPGTDGACYAALMDELRAWPGGLGTVALTLPLLRRWRDGAEQSVGALCRLMAAALAEAGIERAIPCGWSFGGMLAANLLGWADASRLTLSSPALLIDAFGVMDAVGGGAGQPDAARETFDAVAGLLSDAIDGAALAELREASVALLQVGATGGHEVTTPCIALLESAGPAHVSASSSWPRTALLHVHALDAHHYALLRRPWVQEVASWIMTSLDHDAAHGMPVTESI
ncbi:non-ribosomal peptide synthetase [Burkholderia humptydooensis]|uniref:Non-ribosomal peptide synthetase n=2 Tax=Burkholderia humptydooensis TaxID=430531 RepID=A0A7T2U8T8_9BURK|nr:MULTISPECIES: non-ribosomal peptide synthetase [Burkholderia]AJY40417.1 amino acid adenylation domain protein [Burkholderia sp. 2002721687]QPS47791.1 non-ribosomal peptide synthetase [Burkholderia humptydooensis]